MKAILIAVDGETTLVEQAGLDDLQRLVDGDIELVDVPGRVDAVAYINEDGKASMTPNGTATTVLRESLRSDDWIAGPCVVTGFDPRDGENRPVPKDLGRLLAGIGLADGPEPAERRG